MEHKRTLVSSWEGSNRLKTWSHLSSPHLCTLSPFPPIVSESLLSRNLGLGNLGVQSKRWRRNTCLAVGRLLNWEVYEVLWGWMGDRHVGPSQEGPHTKPSTWEFTGLTRNWRINSKWICYHEEELCTERQIGKMSIDEKNLGLWLLS